MRLVDKQLLKDLVAPFVFGVGAFTSVFFAGAILPKLTIWLMNGNMSMSTALQVVLLSLPSIIVYTLPMATLLGVLLGIGRLSGDSEVVALFAGGVSLYRLAVPVIALGVLVSVGAIMLNEIVSPWANRRSETIIASITGDVQMSDRPFTLKDEGTESRVEVSGGMDLDTGTLHKVTIIQYSDARPMMIVYAERARWMGINDPTNRYKWRLYNGYVQTIGTNSPAYLEFERSQTREVVIQKTPTQLSLYQREPEQMSFSEITRLVKHVKEHPDRPVEDIRALDVERWNKLALPFSSLVFAMLALPLAIRPTRSASSVGLGLSILLIFVYWMIWRYTSQLAARGSLEPLVGAFLADALGIVAAIILMKKAAK